MNDWSDESYEISESLELLVKSALEGGPIELPGPCPSCRAPRDVRLYFDAQNSGKHGSYWVWCTQCKVFSHGSIKPPTWWRNCPQVSRDRLDAFPGYLDSIKEEIDAHWELLGRREGTPDTMTF